MKKTFLFTLFLLIVCIAGAKPVDISVAKRVAENLLHKTVVDATPADFSQCYLFIGADSNGFVLVSADDCVRPVLAYSRSERFSTENLPQHIRHWLTAYQTNIAALVEDGAIASSKVQSEWQNFLGAKYHFVHDTAVGPLITTQWSQGYPYNLQCPYDASAQTNAYTGCVATALAQVMKYWNHPVVGRGSHSYVHNIYGTHSANFDTTHYDWTHMPDSPSWESTDQERYAVAQLMYHAGVAVEMKYGTHASSAQQTSHGEITAPSSENALKNYFRYNQGLFSIAKVDYSDTEWDSLLTAELDASRPMLICGSDGDGGHAFIVDGYDSLGFFHINWGWGGYCDGFFTLDSLNPFGSGIGGNTTDCYNNDVEVTIHIYPASENTTVTINAVSADPSMGTVSGGGTFAPYAQNVTLMATAPEGYRFVSWKSGCHYNPFRFSPNNDFSDTAFFAPLDGDTIGYCHNGLNKLWSDYVSYPLEWGIRIPASVIAARRQLEQVQLYAVSDADYTLKIYSGTMPDRQLYSTNFSSDYWGWISIPITTPIPLIDTTPLWIVFTCGTYSNPVTATNYCGNSNASWYKRDGTTWEPVTARGDYYSWMIRAILGPLSTVDIDVQSSDESTGTVSGSGSYYPGDTAVLLATAAPGYRFAGWSTGDTDNPLYLRVTTGGSIIGSFLRDTGIDPIDSSLSPFTSHLSGLTLTVENPSGNPVDLYDITGRLLATFNSPLSTFNFQLPGVYLLRSGTTVQKIVVQ